MVEHHLSSVFGEGGLLPIVRFDPPDRLRKVLFLAVSPDGQFSDCVARF